VIAKTVKDAAPECEAFVGVIVERIVPASLCDVNWALKGLRYGTAEREKCNAAISAIVEQLQQEFIICDEDEHQARKSASAATSN
jgi:hypothetical protein